MNPQEIDKPSEDVKKPDVEADGQSTPSQPKLQRKAQIIYILLLVAAVLAMLLVSLLIKRPSNPEEYVKTSGYIGVFAMAVIGSASPVWPLSGSLSSFIAGGLHLNPLIIGLAAGFGEPIGEVAFYTIGYGSQVVIGKWKRYAQIMNWVKRYGGPTIFVLSAIPNFFIKLATTAAGALRYPIWKFLIFCWGGKTIKSLGFAFLGYYLFDTIKDLIYRIF